MNLNNIGYQTRKAVAIFLTTALFCGCSLLPASTYRQPQLSLPGQWQGQAVTGTAIAQKGKWWQNFKDPLLDGLIERALAANSDLAAATIRVRRARLQSGLADTNLTPTVTVGANTSFSRDLKKGADSRTHTINGELSYELDLWGKLASSRNAARWEAEASEEDCRNTALSLIATTAAAYWQTAFLNKRITTSEAGIAYAAKTVELVQAKYRAGAVSGIDLVQARQTLAGQKAELTQLLRQRGEARNAMAILFDQAPQNAVSERGQLPDSTLPAVAAGLPAGLLGQRPDLRAAELRLRESLANVDVSRADFYPSFTLTGSLGSSSTSLTNALQNPIASLGAGLLLPFLQWNTTRLTLKVSETEYEEAVVNFRQSLYKALSEVENALAAIERYREESLHLEEALALSRQAEQLAEIRFQAGATGVQAWLDEQQRRRSAETALAENRLNRLNSLMKLYQALGRDMRTGAGN